MSNSSCLGWRVLEDVWDAFNDFVVDKWGCTDGYARFEIESAMREYLDQDGNLAEAETLLRGWGESHQLSSSSNTAAGITLDGDTKKLGHRVSEDLKEEFASFVKKHCTANPGAVLSRALYSYYNGGRARRVRDLVHQFVTGGISGDTTAESNESRSEVQGVRDTTGRSDESTSRSDESDRDTTSESDENTDRSAESGQVDAFVVSGIASDLGDNFLREEMHKLITKRVNGERETIELYSEAITSYKNVVKHPANDRLFITQESREQIEVYTDRDASAYPRLPVSDECSDALSEPRSEQAGVERTA